MFRSGDTATAVYVLRQGIVVVGVELTDTRHVVTAVHGPGRAFGWSCVLQGLVRPASALALSDCAVSSIPSGLVRGMAESDPLFAAVIYRNMAQRGLRALFTLAGQMRSPAGGAEKLERCPELLKDSYFQWRVNGAMVEAKCSPGPGCAASRCPIKDAAGSDWKPLMIGRFGRLGSLLP